MYAGRAPRTLTYTLTEAGFTAGDRFFRFDNLTGFALVESLGGPNFYELVFTQKQNLAPYLKALVPNERAQELGDFLGSRLATFEYAPSLGEAIMNRLGL